MYFLIFIVNNYYLLSLIFAKNSLRLHIEWIKFGKLLNLFLGTYNFSNKNLLLQKVNVNISMNFTCNKLKKILLNDARIFIKLSKKVFKFTTLYP